CRVTHSFVAGTQVLLLDGTSKPIEKVQPGDTVLADPVSGERVTRQVTHTIPTDDDKQFVDVTVRGEGKGRDHTITTTEHHPFWSVTRGWVDAGDLRPGELLRTAAGTYVQVGAVRRYEAHEPTYDLSVDATHTYF